MASDSERRKIFDPPNLGPNPPQKTMLSENKNNYKQCYFHMLLLLWSNKILQIMQKTSVKLLCPYKIIKSAQLDNNNNKTV